MKPQRRRYVVGIVASCALGVSVAAGVAGGERTSEPWQEGRHLLLSGDAKCERCRLDVERVAKIADREGQAGLKPPAPQDIRRTSAGHLIVITTNPNRPLHFDAGGRFLGELGQRGQGPGDYLFPMKAVEGPEDDSIWILDVGLARLTAWTARGEHLRSYPMSLRLQDLAVVDDGELIVSGRVRTPEGIGFPFHRLTVEGQLLESFGPEVNVDPTRRDSSSLPRGLASSIDGGFWAFSRDEYRVERFTGEGELVTTLERSVEWFPAEKTRVTTNLAEDGPQPQIRDLVQDDGGLLYVLLSVPDPDWRLGLGERELQPGFEAAGVYWTPVLDHSQVFDFVIEVIDPSKGDVLISERFDTFSVGGWVDSHHFATYQEVDLDEDNLDVPVVEIYHVRFLEER